MCIVLESVEDDRGLVKFVSQVEHLGGDHWGVAKAGGLAADLLAAQQDVLSMSSDEEQQVLFAQ